MADPIFEQVEYLRRAAAALREKASQATPGRWKLDGMRVAADQDGTSNADTAVPVGVTWQRVEGKPRTFDAHLICLMQPQTALALAMLLDNEAAAWESAFMGRNTARMTLLTNIADSVLGKPPVTT